MSHALSEEEIEERNIQQWRIRKMVQGLEKARGNGTSMISLIIPPGEQITRHSRMLTEEYGTASNIKSRVNRLSVLDAIVSTQQKLKLYNKVPPTGLVIYCGTIIADETHEKKVNLDIIPHKPINTSLYFCDNKFHTECLSELMESDEKYGFIIMDGSGSLFGLLSGNTRTILNKISVDLPKKHGRGGQSAVRFSRLRTEKRHNYIRKVAELAIQLFINNERPNVSGLVLAGLADFKNELATSDMFDLRLRRIIIKIVDVSYGGENGFNQAIEQSQETLKNVKFVLEKKIISKFFEEIAQDTKKFCFGIRDTMHALESGAVETLLLYEDLPIYRHELINDAGERKVVYMTNEQEQKDLENDNQNSEWKDENEKVLIVEWFAENYKRFGCHLQFVTNKSQEGAQFLQGFGGIGGILRYQIEFSHLDEENYIIDEDDDGEYDFDF